MFRVFWALVLSVVFSLCFLPDAIAQQNRRTRIETTESVSSAANTRGEKILFLRYYEEGQWHVEELVQHQNGWLDTLSKETFNTESAAIAADTKRQQRYPHVESELRGLIAPTPIQLRSEVPGEVLWNATETWSWEWEKKYAQWLTENMNVDFYNKYEVATDCADVAYSARWIFARIHGLPAGNRLSGNTALFNNTSVRAEWAKLPTANEWYNDKRFLAALNYLLDYTYTHQLMRDSYPVAINPDNFLPGVHHLSLHSVSGHTRLVHRVNLTDPGAVPFFVIQSTTPRAVRSLMETLFWDTESPKKGDGGFLRIRWPIVTNGTYTLAPETSMPGYSLEEYDGGFVREPGRGFGIEVMMRLKPDLDFLNMMKAGLDAFKQSVQARVAIVEDGFKKCGQGQCPPGSPGYEDWSTPARDQKIADTLQQLDMLLQVPAKNSDEMRNLYNQELEKTYLTLDGKEYTMKAIRFIWWKKLYSSDPGVVPGQRWALAPEFFANSLKQTIGALLDERQKKAPNFDDSVLKSKAALIHKYCESFSAEHCQMYQQSELVRPTTWLQQTRTLAEWSERISWFNSDPKQTADIQWGGMSDLVKREHLEFFDGILVSEDGFGAISKYSEGAALGPVRVGKMGKNGLEEQSIPPGFQWVGFQKDVAVGYAFQDGKLLRHDFRSSSETVTDIPLHSLSRIYFLDSGNLLLTGDNTLLAMEVTANGLQLKWQTAQDQVRYFSKQKIVILRSGDVWSVLDFKSSTPEVLKTDGDLFETKFIAKNNQRIVLRRLSSLLSVDVKTGHVSDLVLPVKGRLQQSNSSFTVLWVYDENGEAVREVKLNEDLTVIQDQTLGLAGSYNQNYVLVRRQDQSVIYKLTETGSQVLPLQADELETFGLAVPWVNFKLRNGLYRIRNIETGEVVYEGAQIYAPYTIERPILGFKRDQNSLEVKVISLKNPGKPALMTGNVGGYYTRDDDSGSPAASVSRGALLANESGLMWVEFPPELM